MKRLPARQIHKNTRLSSLKSFFKDTVIYGIAAVLPRVISIALVPVITAVLVRAEFSDQTTWYVYAAFINVFLTLGMETAFFRFYTNEKNKENVVSSSFSLLIFSSVLFAILGTLFSTYISVSLGFPDSLFIKILVWTTALDTLVVIPYALLRVTNRPIKFMFIKVVNVLIWFVLTSFFLLFLPKFSIENGEFLNTIGISTPYKPGVFHIILANLLASFITLILLVPEILKIRWRVDKVLINKMLRYSLPIMIGGIAYAVNENIDKLIIQRLIDKEANGVYSACYKLGVFMTLYITAFRMGAEPFFFNNAAAVDAKEKYSKIMTWFVILGCLFMVFVVGFLDIFASLFIKQKEYLPGLIIVPIILLANLFSGIYNNLGIWYKLTDKTKFGMYISILGAILTVVSLFAFVPILGIMGGAWATLFTYMMMAAISYYFGSKYYPVDYEINKLVFYIVISAGLCYVSFVIFRGNYYVSASNVIILLGAVFIIEIGRISNIKTFLKGK